MAARRSESEWRALVAEWQASGESRKAFASRRGLAQGTFTWWAWRLRERTADAEPAFLDVVVVDSVVEEVPDLIVDVGQVRVRVAAGFDAQGLLRLVDALC